MATRDAHSEADRAFHDATADLYEPTLEARFRAYTKLGVKPWLDELPRLTPGRDALDVGCGTAVMAIRLAERGYRVYGVDHSEGMLTIANRKIEQLGLADQIELRQGDVRALPYDAERFDIVTCQGVLHHLADMRPCVAEIARVLKPGGVFYLAEPNDGTTPVLKLFERLASLKPILQDDRD